MSEPKRDYGCVAELIFDPCKECEPGGITEERAEREMEFIAEVMGAMHIFGGWRLVWYDEDGEMHPFDNRLPHSYRKKS